jgi:HEAT repeat protein
MWPFVLLFGLLLVTSTIMLGAAAWWFWSSAEAQLQDAVAAEVQAREAEAIRVEIKPFNPAEFRDPFAQPRDLDDAVAILNHPHEQLRHQLAAEWLQQKPVQEKARAIVARALEKRVQDPDPFTREAVMHALVLWADPASAAVLLPLVENTAEDSDWVLLMAVLTRLKDERAAAPGARGLTTFFRRQQAGKTLQALGSVAEPEVLPLLENADWQTRQEVCRVLAVIGTSASVAPLERLAERDWGMADLAGRAVAAIKARENGSSGRE